GVGAGHLAPVGGVLAAGGGVEHATDLFDLLGDHDRVGAALGALEEHVFEEVGNPGDGWLFVARADVVVEDQAGRAHAGHRPGDDANAVGKGGLVIGRGVDGGGRRAG